MINENQLQKQKKLKSKDEEEYQGGQLTEKPLKPGQEETPAKEGEETIKVSVENQKQRKFLCCWGFYFIPEYRIVIAHLKYY